jgi:hypothetical protein
MRTHMSTTSPELLDTPTAPRRTAALASAPRHGAHETLGRQSHTHPQRSPTHVMPVYWLWPGGEGVPGTRSFDRVLCYAGHTFRGGALVSRSGVLDGPLNGLG